MCPDLLKTINIRLLVTHPLPTADQSISLFFFNEWLRSNGSGVIRVCAKRTRDHIPTVILHTCVLYVLFQVCICFKTTAILQHMTEKYKIVRTTNMFTYAGMITRLKFPLC